MISEGGTEGRAQRSPRYYPKKLYVFLSYFVQIGILFNYYCTGILCFPDNARKNEGSEIHSFQHLSGKYTFSCPELAGFLSY